MTGQTELDAKSAYREWPCSEDVHFDVLWSALRSDKSTEYPNTGTVTQAISQVLEQVAQLSGSERAEFRDLFLQRFADNESFGEITDEDIDEMSRRSFQRLDKEENAAGAL